MDVDLTENARLFLHAEAAAKRPRSGVLLGHVRGPRWVVEAVYPCPKTEGWNETGFWNLQRIFAGRVIGFYSSRRPAENPSRLFRPFACGKLFLAVAAGRGGAIALRAWAIEFDGRFRLSPLRLARTPKE